MKKMLFFFLLTAIVAIAPTHATVSESDMHYRREFYPNGSLKAEGWNCREVKEGYWKFYHRNGKLASRGHFNKNKKNGYWYYYLQSGHLEKEGHFKHDLAENWWIFYEIGSDRISKFQYRNNMKNGYCLRYNGKRLMKAERYRNNVKTGEWTSLRSFRRDNPNVSF